MPREKVVKRTLADGSVKEYRYGKAPAVRTVGWVIAQYQRSQEFRGMRPNTQDVYWRAMKHINASFGEVPVAEIRRRHVKGHRDTFADRPALANQIHAMWVILLEYAVEEEYILANVAARIGKLVVGEHRRWPAAAIAHAQGALSEHMRRAVVLALYTGQREGDCVAMQWPDYDGQGISVVQEKTGAKLWIPCHPALKAELDAWKAEAMAAKVPATTILTMKNGRPWASARQFCKMFCKAKRGDSALDGLVFHGLRKSAAAALAEAGCTTHEIAAITGHASLKEIERYTREAEQKKRAETAMGKLLAFSPGGGKGRKISPKT